jgi:putative transposase
VQTDGHFLAVTRYVERNALRANLVEQAEAWRWSSLWRRQQDAAWAERFLHRWPVAMPGDWVRRVNRPMRAAELDAVRRCVERGRPYGSERWIQSTAVRLGLESSLHPRGRPRKAPLPE